MRRTKAAVARPHKELRPRWAPLIDRYGLSVLLLLCLAFYVSGWSGGLSFGHDDSLYISTAHSLSVGRGYRLESVPGEPFETKYPLLFPALLALLWKVDPEYPGNIVLFKCANTILWLAAMAVAYRTLVRFRYSTPPWALTILALWGFSSNAVSSAAAVMSEALCTLMVTASIWFCEKELDRPDEPTFSSRALLASIFAGLAFLARSSVVLLPVALVWALSRRSRRLAIPAIAGALPPWAGWMAWSRMHPKVPYWDLRLHYVDYFGWTIAQYTLTPLPIGILANVLDAVLFSLPNQTIYYLSSYLPGQGLSTAIFIPFCIVGFLVTALMSWGGVLLWRQGRPLALLTVICLLLPAIVMPSTTQRYLVPCGWLVLLLTLRGCQEVYARIARWPALRYAALGLAGIALLSDARLALDGLNARLQPPEPHVWGAAMAWVRDNVPPGDAVLSEIDPLMYLHTGRKGISDRNWMKIGWYGLLPQWEGRVGYSPEPDKLLAELRRMGVRWGVDVGDPTGDKGYGFPNILRARPNAFELYYTTGRGGFHIYRMK